MARAPAHAVSRVPRVSICIPTRDRLQLLLEAVSSVRTNGYPSFEIVVSDDAGEPEVARALRALRDPRIRYFSHRPRGIQYNWSNAVRHARAPLVMKLDDDDLLLPGFLARTCGLLERHPGAAIAFSAHRSRDVRGTVRDRVDRGFFAGREVVPGFAYAEALLCNRAHPINHKSAGVFRRAAAARLGYFDKLGADVYFTVGMASLGDVAYAPEPLFLYRAHPGTREGHNDATVELCFDSLANLFRFPWIERDAGWRAIRAEAERTQRLLVPIMYVANRRATAGRRAARELAARIARAHPEVLQNRMYRAGTRLVTWLPPGVYARLHRYYSRSAWSKRVLSRLAAGARRD